MTENVRLALREVGSPNPDVISAYPPARRRATGSNVGRETCPDDITKMDTLIYIVVNMLHSWREVNFLVWIYPALLCLANQTDSRALFPECQNRAS